MFENSFSCNAADSSDYNLSLLSDRTNMILLLQSQTALLVRLVLQTRQSEDGGAGVITVSSPQPPLSLPSRTTTLQSLFLRDTEQHATLLALPL